MASFDHNVDSLSIPTAVISLGQPMLGPSDFRDVDAIEQHGQGGRVELDTGTVWRRQSKSATIQSLVPQDQTPTLKAQNLSPTFVFRDKNKKVATVNILAGAHDQSCQAIKTASHVGGFREKQDANNVG